MDECYLLFTASEDLQPSVMLAFLNDLVIFFQLSVRNLGDHFRLLPVMKELHVLERGHAFAHEPSMVHN